MRNVLFLQYSSHPSIRNIPYTIYIHPSIYTIISVILIKERVKEAHAASEPAFDNFFPSVWLLLTPEGL